MPLDLSARRSPGAGGRLRPHRSKIPATFLASSTLTRCGATSSLALRANDPAPKKRSSFFDSRSNSRSKHAATGRISRFSPNVYLAWIVNTDSGADGPNDSEIAASAPSLTFTLTRQSVGQMIHDEKERWV